MGGHRAPDETIRPAGARTDALLALRRAAAAWKPLAPLLSAAVPDSLELAEEEVAELLGTSVPRALAAVGFQVHWPREFARSLTSRAVIGPDGGTGPSGADGQDPRRRGLPARLDPGTLLRFDWRFAVGDQEVTRAELDRLAEAGRPLVRLRDRWVLVSPQEIAAARQREDRRVGTLEALDAVLTGAAGTGAAGREAARVEIEATGWLETLRERLSDPERREEPPLPAPAELRATLRDYQSRGLDWLHRMTSLGLGGCLADDMGLGKTLTLIALHLRRQHVEGCGGPTLVVCPASLVGNWQREIERFAPDTPVRRHHGPNRSLEGLREGEFVLTTYGTMRLDSDRLVPGDGEPWGMVVADEAQHVKNPFAATAKALRTIPARARVALTGTPVENNLSELWAVLDWTTPGLLGRLGTFRRRYADAAEGGDPVAAERLARLVRPFLLRRRKTDPGVAPELPPKTETDRAVALTPEQAGLYEAVVARESLEALEGTEGFERRGLVVALLTSLKQICNHPAQYLGEHRGRLSGRSGKLELLDELLDVLLAEGASILVFTQYVQMARLLERHLASRRVPTQCLHGGTPAAPARRDGAPLPGGGRTGVPALPQGRRDRSEPHTGEPCHPLRPLVEPGGRGPGHRPGPPHRPDPARSGAPAGHGGNRRGPDRRHAAAQAGTGGLGARHRRGAGAGRTHGFRTGRARRAAEGGALSGGDEQEHVMAEAGSGTHMSTAAHAEGAEGRERVFAPLPPAHGRSFARTWWGRTWLKALEDTALDGAQLKLGRAFARRGAVGAVAVRPGRITALVLGTDRTPCRADVLLRRLTADEWDRLLDVVVAQSGHIAALLDRDMPPRLVEDAADAGLDLLPGIGDLEPECACGGWDHCAHTAALSYQTARLLDEDPLALLLMRAGGESGSCWRRCRCAARHKPPSRTADRPGQPRTRRTGRRGWTPRRRSPSACCCPRCPNRPCR